MKANAHYPPDFLSLPAWDMWTGRVIFAALLVVIALAAIPYASTQPWTEALVEFLLFCLGIAAASHSLISRQPPLPTAFYRLLAPFGLLAGYVYVQTVNFGASGAISYDPYGTRLFLYKMLALLVVLALLWRYTNSTRRLTALVWLVLGLAIACALFGIARQTLQHDEIGFLLPLLKRGNGYAQYINKNHFATLMLLALGLMLGLGLGHSVRRGYGMILLALAVPLWATLILCGSRSGIFGLLGQLAGIGLLLPVAQPQTKAARRPLWLRWAGSWAGRAVLIIVLLAGGLLSVIWLGGEEAVARFERVADETVLQTDDGTNATRLAMWRSTWRLFQAHPLTGAGFGGYWIGISTVHDGSGRLVPQQAHNDYLEILASGGIIGTFLVILCVAAVIWVALPQLKSDNALRRAACLGALTGLFGWAVQSLFEFGGHITFNALIITILVALATLPGPRAETT